MSAIALTDRTLPCRTPSAVRRHLARIENCTVCGVAGAVPEYVWRRKPATPAVRAPESQRRFGGAA